MWTDCNIIVFTLRWPYVTLVWAAVLMFIVSVYLFSLNEIKPEMKEQRRKPASANKYLIDKNDPR